MGSNRGQARRGGILYHRAAQGTGACAEAADVCKDSIFGIAKDIDRNIIYVGEGHEHKGLSRSCLRIEGPEIHWIRPDLAMEDGEIRRARVRIRYRQPLQDAWLIRREEALYILFDSPQRGVTPGQFAVWYEPMKNGDEDNSAPEMIGSGPISR